MSDDDDLETVSESDTLSADDVETASESVTLSADDVETASESVTLSFADVETASESDILSAADISTPDNKPINDNIAILEALNETDQVTGSTDNAATAKSSNLADKIGNALLAKTALDPAVANSSSNTEFEASSTRGSIDIIPPTNETAMSSTESDTDKDINIQFD